MDLRPGVQREIDFRDGTSGAAHFVYENVSARDSVLLVHKRGSCIDDAARALVSFSKRRQVGGRRVKRIDARCHLILL